MLILILYLQEHGADCVKLQKSCLPAKFTAAALNRPYSGPQAMGPTYGEHKRKLELSDENFKELLDYAASINIPLAASAMDIVSYDTD